MSVQIAPDWYSINLINLLELGEFIEVSEALDNSFSDGKRMKNDVAMSIKEIENKISELKTKKEHVENRLRLREFFNYMMVFSALFFFAYINLQIFILNQRIPYINIISNSLLYIVRSLFRYIKLLPLIAVVPYIIVIIRKSMIRKTDLEIQYFEKLIDFKKGILKEDALEEYRGKLNEMKNISLRPRRLEDLDEEEFEFITQLMPNQIASDIKKELEEERARDSKFDSVVKFITYGLSIYSIAREILGYVALFTVSFFILLCTGLVQLHYAVIISLTGVLLIFFYRAQGL